MCPDISGFDSRYIGHQATGVAISLTTAANALDTAAGVKQALAELEPYFPPCMKAVVPFDTTPFVQVSIKGVVMTLLEAIVLVFLVMYQIGRASCRERVCQYV